MQKSETCMEKKKYKYKNVMMMMMMMASRILADVVDAYAVSHYNVKRRATRRRRRRRKNFGIP